MSDYLPKISAMPFLPIKYRWLLGLGLALGPAIQPAWAQDVVPVVPLAKKVEYFDKENNLLPTAEGAWYRVETMMRGSFAGTRREYYNSGKLKSSIPFGDVSSRIEHGGKTTWYESGQMHTKEDYVVGKRQGELLVYYPDGVLRRRDHFEKGIYTGGECFAADGKPVAHWDYMTVPVYTEGLGDNAAIVYAIQRRTEYPREALYLALNARILIAFVVNTQGQVVNPRIEKEPPAEQIADVIRPAFVLIKKSALAATRKLKAFKPGTLDGEPVAVGYTVPITFRIR